MNKPSRPPQFIKLFVAIAAVACLILSVGYQRAAAQASTTFTISGTVKDTTGAAMANTMVILISDVTGTQITFTDQSGNYALTYLGGMSHSLRILPSKSGFIFNPLLVIFTGSGTLTGDRTINFEGTPIPVVLSVVQPPILLTQENSLRALALDSVTWTGEPFGVNGPLYGLLSGCLTVDLGCGGLASGRTNAIVTPELPTLMGMALGTALLLVTARNHRSIARRRHTHDR